MLISWERKNQHQTMSSNMRRKCLSLYVSEPFSQEKTSLQDLVRVRLSFPMGCLLHHQEEKLSEVEQQLKKTEEAHRRKTQAENAARESEAEAIRKILGQDSSRKKKEDKLQK